MNLPIIIAFILLFSPIAGFSAQKNKFVPPNDKVLLIIGQDINNIQNYLRSVGVIPAGYAVYTSVEFVDGLKTRADHGGGVQHANALLDSRKPTVLQVGLHMVGTLERVYSGVINESLDRLASWIQETDRPVYLRIGYEFDNPENRYDPEQYVKAYQYIVDYFKRKNVNNVAYVWHSFAAYTKRPITDWYPGDAYVDWFALSYFRNPDRYKKAIVDLAREKGKPVMIAEASPWHAPTTLGSNSWKSWFAKLFYFVEENDIKALCYINCDWDSLRLFKKMRWGDGRVQSSKYVKEQWIKETSNDKYLKSSPTLFQELKFNPVSLSELRTYPKIRKTN